MKRLLSCLLVLTMLFAMMPVRIAAEEESLRTAADSGDLTVEGTNGFGNLLSQEIRESQEASSGAADGFESGYSVIDLTFEDNAALVEYSSLEEAILVVAVYSEDGLQLLASGETLVDPEAETVTVTMEGDMPEYFLASAYLMDTYDLSPLCAAYDTPMYTREMQELLSSTVSDYDPERVLNLDEDETTNFAVYADGTIVIEGGDGTNRVMLADEENSTYVIADADERVTGLNAGDVFVYPYAENEILIVKVASIEVDGTVATITGDDELEMEEVFSHVKIEGAPDSEDITVDDRNASEGVSYAGEADINFLGPDEGISTQGVESGSIDGSTELVAKVFNIDFVDYGDDNHKVTVTGSVGLKIKVSLQLYWTKSLQRVEFKLNGGLQGELSVTGKISKSVVLCSINGMIVPGVDCKFEVSFYVSLTGTASFVFGFDLMGGFAFQHDQNGFSYDKLYKPAEPIVKTEFSGTLYLALRLTPVVELLKGVVWRGEVDFEFGLELKLALPISADTLINDERHDCAACFDGDISFVFRIVPKMKFFMTDKLYFETDFGKIKVKWIDIYSCPEHDVLISWGECPEKAYKLTVTVTDEGNQVIPGTTVVVDGSSESVNEHGSAVFWVKPGTHSITAYASVDNAERRTTCSRSITEGSKVRLWLMETAQPGGPSGGEEEPSGDWWDEIDFSGILDRVERETITDHGAMIGSGSCGENLNWELYEDGFLYIWGYGAMDSSPFTSYRSQITSVKLGKGCTSIGNSVFSGCKNLRHIVIPGTVSKISSTVFSNCDKLTSAGPIGSGCAYEFGWTDAIPDYAFYNLDGLTEVTLPEGLARIGGYVFSNCDALKTLELPDTVVAIGRHAFNHSGLTELELPDSVGSIGDYAFYDCDGLTEMMIPSNVKTISNHLFYNCDSLASVVMEEGCIEIGGSAFDNCKNLSRVIVPGTVNEISSSAFSNCGKLTSAGPIGSGCAYEFGWTDAIPNNAFDGLDGLTDVTLPYGLTRIGKSAFDNCDVLKTLELPDTLVVIGEYAFSYSGLTELEVPDSVITIGNYAFSNSALTDITFRGSAPVIGSNAFYKVTAAACYPSNDGTWSESVRKDYGGTITWVPYSVTNANEMVLDLSAAVTAAAERTAQELLRTEPVKTESGKIPAAEQGEKDQPVGLDAVYSGEYGTADTEIRTLKTAAFTGLVPGQQYVLLAMISIDVENPLSSDNLLAIDQGTALEDGTLSFAYVQRVAACPSYVVACGASNKDLANAEITFPVMASNGEPQAVDPVVVYDGETLTEGEDYTVVGTVSFTEPGEYACMIRGIRQYSGLVACSYTVLESVYDAPMLYFGDVTRDGLVNIRDILHINAYRVSMENGTGVPERISYALEEFLLRGDLDRDGDADLDDIWIVNDMRLDNGVTQEDAMDRFVSCEITGQPKTRYLYGEMLDTEGLAMELTFDTGVSYTVTEGLRVRGYDPLQSGSQTLNVTFFQFGAEYTVRVEAAGVIASGMCGENVTWTLDENGVLTIAGSGDMTDHLNGADAPWHSWREQITSLVIEHGVTAIGSHAFEGCTEITAVTIPESVARIGSGAFSDCGGLRSITFLGDAPEFDGSYVFRGVAAAARYPADNPTWTEEVMRDYGGAITWVPDEPAHEHAYEAAVTAPTCTEQGCTVYTCACGDSYAEDFVDALGHDYADGICVRCGGEDPDDQKPVENPFTDVPEGSFYYEPVLWAMENSITTGTSATTFNPTGDCQRAHVVTFLWRAAGQPEPASAVNPFEDVKETDFYYKAVLWAVEKGITTGLDVSHFGPFALCNRAQVVTFLYRAMGSPEVGAGESPFADVTSGAWFEAPILWAVENGITTGMGNGLFGVGTVCNRAQVVTFLYRTYVN